MMKKLIAIILVAATLSALCAMPAGAAGDPLAAEFDSVVGYCDMFYESLDWYAICQANRVFVEWDYSSDEPPVVTVPAAEYEAVLAKYCVLSDELLQDIRSYENYGDELFYDPENNVYNAFFIGGWGGFMRERFYAGYIKTGADTYDVYFEQVTYEFLDEVLPEGMTTADIVGEEWPETIEYGGHIYQSGMDGYYRIKSYDKCGKKYGVKVENGNVLIASRENYDMQPERFDDVVIEPTVITKQPSRSYVKAGATAKFTVKATGDGLRYQWQSSSNGKTWKNCASATAKKASFTFTSKASHNGNYYRCKITNSQGDVVYTNAVRLYVLSIATQPKAQKVEAGDTVKFTVKATGSGLKYQWQSSSNGKTWKNCSSSSATKATFTFTGKTSHNGNYYRCKVTDSKGNVVYTDTVRLYVLGITEQPVKKTVTKGKTAKFEVEATGAGKVYQWQVSTDGGKTWKNCSSASAKKATFTFTAKTSHNGNYYRCRVKDNGGNTVYTNKVKLTVK